MFGEVGGVFGSRTVSWSRLPGFIGIEDGHVVRTQLERTVEQTFRVHRRIAAIGRDNVVQVRLGIGPVPPGDDDVALEALRPRRGRRQLAGLMRSVQSARRRETARGRSGSSHGIISHRPGPRRAAVPTPASSTRRSPSAAGISRVALLPSWWHARQVPFFTGRSHSGWLRMSGDAVARRPGAGEVARRRRLHQREPVAGGVVVAAARAFGAMVALRFRVLPGVAVHLRRVDEPVATHPHAVVRRRQVREQIPAAIVGDDDLRELRRQIAASPRSPRRRLPAFGAGDDAADVVGVDGHGRRGRRGRLLRRPGAARHQPRRDRQRCHSCR